MIPKRDFKLLRDASGIKGFHDHISGYKYIRAIYSHKVRETLGLYAIGQMFSIIHFTSFNVLMCIVKLQKAEIGYEFDFLPVLNHPSINNVSGVLWFTIKEQFLGLRLFVPYYASPR